MTSKLIFTVLLASLAGAAFAQPAAISSWDRQDNLYPDGDAPQMAGGLIVGDNLYVVGGNSANDGDTDKTWILPINKYDGTVGAAAAGVALPTADNFAYLFETVTTASDHIYISGGGYNSTGPNRQKIASIGLASDGSFADTAWSESATFPNVTTAPYDPELGGAVIPENGYLYTFGGDGEVVSTFDACFYAKVNTDGTLGAFQAGTSLPASWWFPGVASVGNYIIAHPGIVGDKDRANSSDSIYVCQVNTDGTMGSWVEQTEKVPNAIYNLNLVAVDNTIFALGGRSAVDGTSQTTVWRATFDTGAGTVGAWTATDTQLPIAVQYHDAAYSPESKSLYIFSIRQNDGTTNAVQNTVLVSSPLSARPVQSDAVNFSLYQ